MVGASDIAVRPRRYSEAGKRVGRACYLHVTALSDETCIERTAVDRATQIAGIGVEAFNVVKIEGDPPNRVSLLAYEDFDTAAFPALLDSWTIDLTSHKSARRRYRNSRNPPILHRKELLLSLDDPRREIFGRLTEELECRGLFRRSNSIGFRYQWNRRLKEAGVVVRDHLVLDASRASVPDQERPAIVKRHRTAISRQSLSAPMQALARHGFLEGDKTVFDYGCGRGDDISILRTSEVPVMGWDPHYSSTKHLEPSDVVNLGFVLNVIEEAEERVEALRAAYELAGQVLAVAVMVTGKADTSNLRPYRDGFITALGTFQKYFSQSEARLLIERTTGQEAIAVAPGVFFVFCDKIAEQRFLEGRRRQRDISHLLGISRAREKRSTKREALFEENREIVEAVWERSVELGRAPHLDEVDDSVRRELTERLGSIRNAFQLAQVVYDVDAIKRAREVRTNDLTLYFALNLFSRRRRYRELPPELRRDVKAFFGSYGQAEAMGRRMLFSLSEPGVIYSASMEAASSGTGHLDGNRGLQFDASLINRLPALLRAYIGCAEQLYGDIAEAHQVRIHTQSSKLTLLRYVDYSNSPLPQLCERVKIDLRTQDIFFFDHRNERSSQLLYQKSRYMAKDQLGYERQRAFDEKLASLNLLESQRFGPSKSELALRLYAAGLAVKGFDLISTEAS